MDWFNKMGSITIEDVGYQRGFAFIGIIGKYDPIEAKAFHVKDVAKVT